MNCPTQELLNFLLSGSTIIPETLNYHVKDCSICKRILNNKKLQKLFIHSLTCEETFGDTLRKAKVRKVVEVKVGQLWLMKVPNSKEKITVITTSEVISENGIKAVRISPTTVEHSIKDTDETDLFLDPDDSPIGLPCLVEWWNDRPVLYKQLEKCYGEISKVKTDILMERIKKFPKPISLTNSGKLFRIMESSKGAILSEFLFEKLL